MRPQQSEGGNSALPRAFVLWEQPGHRRLYCGTRDSLGLPTPLAFDLLWHHECHSSLPWHQPSAPPLRPQHHLPGQFCTNAQRPGWAQRPVPAGGTREGVGGRMLVPLQPQLCCPLCPQPAPAKVGPCVSMSLGPAPETASPSCVLTCEERVAEPLLSKGARWEDEGQQGPVSEWVTVCI